MVRFKEDRAKERAREQCRDGRETSFSSTGGKSRACCDTRGRQQMASHEMVGFQIRPHRLNFFVHVSDRALQIREGLVELVLQEFDISFHPGSTPPRWR